MDEIIRTSIKARSLVNDLEYYTRYDERMSSYKQASENRKNLTKARNDLLSYISELEKIINEQNYQ